MGIKVKQPGYGKKQRGLEKPAATSPSVGDPMRTCPFCKQTIKVYLHLGRNKYMRHDGTDGRRCIMSDEYERVSDRPSKKR